MCAVKSEMSRAFVGVVSEVYVCDFGKERARVGGQRVKGKAVDYNTENLGVALAMFHSGLQSGVHRVSALQTRKL